MKPTEPLGMASDSSVDEKQLNEFKQENQAFAEAARTGCRHMSKEELLTLGPELKDKVILLTGGANGIGKEFGIQAASYGAKIAICNTNPDAAKQAVKEMEAAGGKAIYVSPVDVGKWEDQVRFFKFTIGRFGKIDIVVANAGRTEIGDFGGEYKMIRRSDGTEEPGKPDLTTFETNMMGSLWTARLGLHYLRENPARKGKALVLVGSMAGFLGIPGGPMYTTSKHALLGMMRSLYWQGKTDNISVAMIAPWFTDTNIIDAPTRLGLNGLPLCSMEDTKNALLYTASNPKASGHCLIIDDKGVLAIPRDADLLGTSGYYSAFQWRAAFAINIAAHYRDTLRFIEDVWTKLLPGWAKILILFVLFLASLGSLTLYKFVKA